ncbi:hypothetical protein F511_09956 [Dorcoceras hygrometricum]|uniref:Uncharacterized protein n=1 Tax=Dorcoceras hygrometricum TaxID=472368 RepID=A0A2Z7ACZ8_9LAMI|nr:hypothetical protein F511_09956 [Dorcoceras hygrometricum]
MESADEFAMETSRVDSDVRNQAMAKLNQLEHDEPAETMNQLQVLKERSEPAGSCIEKLAEESYSKKKIQVISTADESVSSRKDITGATVISRKLSAVEWMRKILNQQRASTSSWHLESQESAGSLCFQTQGKRRRRVDPVASYSAISRCYLEIAKRCRLHKLIRQRFAIALKIQQEDFALIISADEATVDSVATQRYPDARRFRRSI